MHFVADSLDLDLERVDLWLSFFDIVVVHLNQAEC
jgi:hypothetical protein